MKKTEATIDLKLKVKCPCCNTDQEYQFSELESPPDTEVDALESILRGIVRRFSMGAMDINDTSIKCKKCKKFFTINRLDI